MVFQSSHVPLSVQCHPVTLVFHQVPASSPSIFKSMTLLEVAEYKKSRKPVDEVKMYNEWEESLSSIMKAARAGDAERVAVLMRSEGIRLVADEWS